MKKAIYIIFSYSFLFSCSQANQEKEISDVDQTSEKIETVDLAQLKADSDTIATTSQKALMQNVAAAIKKGGTEYAVEFCNEKAMPITDSLSAKYNVSISRVTNKTRNSANGLKTQMDTSTFQSFAENLELMDSLIQEGEKYVYYKRITTAMPACIKCHGNPETDIDKATYTKIKTLYANDMAVGYGKDELRGLWRIEKGN